MIETLEPLSQKASIRYITYVWAFWEKEYPNEGVCFDVETHSIIKGEVSV